MRGRYFGVWRAATGAAFAGLAIVGCASDATDAIGQATSIEAPTHVVTLPTAPDWVCEPLAANQEMGTGPGTGCGRELEDNRTVLAASMEFSEEVVASHAGEPAAVVLAHLSEAEAEAHRAPDSETSSFSSVPAEHAVTRAGAVCSGSREENVNREENTRVVTRNLICISPQTQRPIWLTYFEEFPEVARQPRPTFEEEANQFFEGLRFR